MTQYNSFESSQQPKGVGTVVIPILWISERSHRETAISSVSQNWKGMLGSLAQVHALTSVLPLV